MSNPTSKRRVSDSELVGEIANLERLRFNPTGLSTREAFILLALYELSNRRAFGTSSTGYLTLLGEYKQSRAITAVEALALARFVEWLDSGPPVETTAPRKPFHCKHGVPWVNECAECSAAAAEPACSCNMANEPGATRHAVYCSLAAVEPNGLVICSAGVFNGFTLLDGTKPTDSGKEKFKPFCSNQAVKWTIPPPPPDRMPFVTKFTCTVCGKGMNVYSTAPAQVSIDCCPTASESSLRLQGEPENGGDKHGD